MNMPGLRRFTLVELLVLIAILAILAAMFMPALRSALEQTRTNQCGNKLRQHGVAHLMYAQDYQGCLPTSGSVYGGFGGYYLPASWPGASTIHKFLLQYLSYVIPVGYNQPLPKDSLVACPSDPRIIPNLGYCQYALNMFYVDGYTKAWPGMKRVQATKFPSRTMIVGESGTNYWTMPTGTGLSGLASYFRHNYNTTCNYFYLDGHSTASTYYDVPNTIIYPGYELGGANTLFWSGRPSREGGPLKNM